MYEINRPYGIANIPRPFYKNDFLQIPPQPQVKFEANDYGYNYFPSET
jgi:hypothetical protein